MSLGMIQQQRTKLRRSLIIAFALVAIFFSFKEQSVGSDLAWPWQTTHAASAEANQPTNGSYYYVSKQGNNQGGASWQTAWNEMNQIDWSAIEPGDTILIDGGYSGITYYTPLLIGSSGVSGNPIRIKVASELGRNGRVTLFGGRDQLLPFCYQPNFQSEENLELFGVKTNDHSWIEIDGSKWSGLTVHGFERSGLRVDRNSRNITIRNVEIYNNGYPKQTSLGTIPEGVGLRLGGENVLLERSIIRDNGQDAIQSLWENNNLRNFRMNESWLYNSRRHPNQNDAFNYCTHTDGLQIYDGGVIRGITIERSVIGPGFTQGLLLGQSRTSNGAWADVRDVVIRDTVVTKSTDNAIYGYRNSDSYNWHLDRVTLDCEITKGHCIYLHNHDHIVSNSVIYKGRVTFEDGLSNFYNNCVWENAGLIVGKIGHPQFASLSSEDRLSQDDYTISNASECIGHGSQVTSGPELMNTSENLPNQPVASTPSPTPDLSQPTATPTPSPTPYEPIQGSGTRSCSGLTQEAENGYLSGNFEIGYDSAASNGEYVYVRDGTGNRGSKIDGTQKIEFCFTVSETGNYRLKGWVYAESLYANSFYLRIDGQPTAGDIWHTKVNVSYGSEYATAQNGYDQIRLHLTPGMHTIEVLLREDGTRLDKLALELAPEVDGSSVQSAERTFRPSSQHLAQWLTGTIHAIEEGYISAGEPITDMSTSGLHGLPNKLTLSGVTANGTPAKFKLHIEDDGQYYIDALPLGHYHLELPLGYTFGGTASPILELGGTNIAEHQLSFTYRRQQLFLPLIQ